ncbi:hypothetical protein [Pseudoxanthomonas sp.]|uniref:hypothetical protein n=1 Tax=Pseudoxanthomonas sp. TaxID=1871049 RepID=UPI00260D3CE9|nr:hypothetical protein [Pseudoxanthomonas sp.]WDS36226.1 MAG: hypothetical protein O8I58_18475 [Pseudoxanthomonas sp.]
MAEIDTATETARMLLERWGAEFALHRDCEYLGHASRNMLQVLIDHKGEMPGRVTGFKPLECDAEALMVEQLVTAVARSNKPMAICLRAYYCGSGRRKVERYETALMLLANAGQPMVKVPAYMDLARRGLDRIAGMITIAARVPERMAQAA